MFVKLLKTSAFLIIVVVSAQTWAQSVESLMETGQQMLQNGAFSQAVTAFRQVLSREPDNFEAQFNLGFAYLGWGRNSNAVEEFKKALRYQPNSSQVWSNLAIAYENLGKSSEAIGALDQAVKYDPENNTARMNLAAEYANANHLKEAIAQYKVVLSKDGMNEDALTNLSKCLINAGQQEEAKNYLKQSIAANPNNAEAHYELGNTYWKKDKDAEKAVSEYKLAISIKPDPNYFESLALLYEEKGKKNEALETWKKDLTFTDDVLAKDKIQARIDRLEGKSSIQKTSSDDSNDKLTTTNQIDDLKKELRKGGSAEETRRIETKPVDVTGDLNDLNSDTDDKTLDLKSEAKKRAAK